MKKLMAIAVSLAMLLAVAGPGQADSRGGGHNSSSGHSVGAVGHGPGLGRVHPGSHFEGHRGFDRHQDFSHGHGRVFIGVGPTVVFGPSYPYWWGYPVDSAPAYPAPAYSAPAPAYWYYCPSARAYYPNVPSCPEAWLMVPAQ
jgi:hypothetical protein